MQKHALCLSIKRVLDRGNPWNIRGQRDRVKPLPLRVAVPDRARAWTPWLRDFRSPATYATKSIVLICFTNIVTISICCSISTAQGTPNKSRILSNLRESLPVRSKARCASPCSLKNQTCSGTECVSCTQDRFQGKEKILKAIQHRCAARPSCSGSCRAKTSPPRARPSGRPIN